MGMTIAEKIIAAAAGVDSVKGVLRYRQTRWKMPQTLGFRYTGCLLYTSPSPRD